MAAEGLQAATPFCTEAFGRPGSDALRLSHTARHKLVQRDGSMLGWAGAALFNCWLALLGCSLQRALRESARVMRGQAGRLNPEGPDRQEPLVGAALLHAQS